MTIFSEEQQEAKSVLNYLFKHGVKILIAFVIGLILAVCITFIIPKKFRSSGIIYPPNSFTRDQLIGNPQFGHETETEQLMQLLESASMRDSVIQKFKLINYYESDTSVVGWKDVLNIKFIHDVKFFRSKYLSVVISAELKDPELAADMVNYIISVVNKYKKSVFSENRDSDMRFYKSRWLKSEDALDSIVSMIYVIKDTNNTENLLSNYKQRLSTENYIENSYIDSREMERLIKKYNLLESQSLKFQLDYERALDERSKPLLDNYIVDRAVPTYKKVSPSFVTNGLIGGVILTIVMLMLLLVRDKYRDFKLNS
ncbi:MAG: hypothetical protein JKY54_07825 [Flavobacteriales bacterium]|nr:hypothetical protein [Flavobacteriales bacterium]